MQGPAGDDCFIIRPFKYLYLQYNVFMIYDDLKAVKVPQKHAANCQGNTSHRSVIPTSCCYASILKLLFGMGVPVPCRFATYASKHS